MVQCSDHYTNTDIIDLDCIYASGSDITSLFYRVWYNDILVYTSPKGTNEGYFRVNSVGASVVETPEGRCLAPGRYTIRFYNG